jgi:hypothetical protein
MASRFKTLNLEQLSLGRFTCRWLSSGLRGRVGWYTGLAHRCESLRSYLDSLVVRNDVDLQPGDRINLIGWKLRKETNPPWSSFHTGQTYSSDNTAYFFFEIFVVWNTYVATESLRYGEFPSSHRLPPARFQHTKHELWFNIIQNFD